MCVRRRLLPVIRAKVGKHWIARPAADALPGEAALLGPPTGSALPLLRWEAPPTSATTSGFSRRSKSDASKSVGFSESADAGVGYGVVRSLALVSQISSVAPTLPTRLS
jgi:hypothetical protein